MSVVLLLYMTLVVLLVGTSSLKNSFLFLIIKRRKVSSEMVIQKFASVVTMKQGLDKSQKKAYYIDNIPARFGGTGARRLFGVAFVFWLLSRICVITKRFCRSLNAKRFLEFKISVHHLGWGWFELWCPLSLRGAFRL